MGVILPCARSKTEDVLMYGRISACPVNVMLQDTVIAYVFQVSCGTVQAVRIRPVSDMLDFFIRDGEQLV